jgi:predicted DNA-binding transcriptional regulator YafY
MGAPRKPHVLAIRRIADSVGKGLSTYDIGSTISQACWPITRQTVGLRILLPTSAGTFSMPDPHTPSDTSVAATGTERPRSRKQRPEISRQERITALHRKLKAARRPIPLKALQEDLGCARATLYRDLGYLRDALGAPLILGGEPSSARYVEREGDTFELPGLWLSSDELHALVALYEMAARSTGAGPLNEALIPLKGRIEKLLAAESGRPGWPDGRVRVVASAARRINESVFRTVASATIEHRRLRFRYNARSTGKSGDRLVSPQRLVHYRDNWYLDAWDHGREALRSFAIDRIESPDAQKDLAQDIPAEQLDAHLAGGYGIFSGPVRATAVIRFSAKAARWVADERWHSRQEGRWLPDGQYELRVPYSNPRELLGDVLRFGGDAEILEPLPLREEAKSMLELAMANYRGDVHLTPPDRD